MEKYRVLAKLHHHWGVVIVVARKPEDCHDILVKYLELDEDDSKLLTFEDIRHVCSSKKLHGIERIKSGREHYLHNVPALRKPSTKYL